MKGSGRSGLMMTGFFLVVCFISLTVQCQRGREIRGGRDIPVIYCTDLFHPHDDPDDHFDIAALFALDELDIQLIVLDQGEKQESRSGHVPVNQMNRISGRSVPWVTGLAEQLRSPGDKATDQPEAFQGGVEGILQVLEETIEPVTVITVGSLRDVAAAFNRAQDLFRQKVYRLVVFIGEASAGTLEWNVGLDTHAFIRVMNSGLPVWWVPCFDGGNFRNRGNASYWKASHSDLLKYASDRVMNFFIHALLQKDCDDPAAVLSEAIIPEEEESVLSQRRNLWCASVFPWIAGRKIVQRAGFYIALPPEEVDQVDQECDIFRFNPVSLTVDGEGKVVYETSERSTPVHRFQIANRAQYSEAMTSVAAHLIGSLGRISEDCVGWGMPDSVDLNPIFDAKGLTPRTQGNRGTCSFFAVTQAIEFALVRNNAGGPRLSPEFLNWASNQAAGDRADGSFFSDLWAGFEDYGISTEESAPYQKTYHAGYLPAMQAMEEAAEIRSLGLAMHWIKRWDPNRGVSERQLQHIRRAIAAGWPVCGGFLWPKASVWDQGLLQMCPRDQVRDGHSVMLTGYRDDEALSGGGAFLIRNSAGPSREGMLTYEYVRAYMNDAVVIRDH